MDWLLVTLKVPHDDVPAATARKKIPVPPPPPPTPTARILVTPAGTVNDPLEVKVCEPPPQAAALIRIINCIENYNFRIIISIELIYKINQLDYCNGRLAKDHSRGT